MNLELPCPAQFNLAQYVLSQAAKTPDKIALAVLGPAQAEEMSFARLEDLVLRTASGLLAKGLKQGDRVLLRLSNHADFPVAFLAAIAVGLVPVPTAAGLTQVEITKMAGLVAPKLILAHPGIALPAPEICPVLNGIEDLSLYPRADYALGDPNRLAYAVFTSGSSGQPRAVAHAHRAVWARRMMWQGWYGLTEKDRMLHAGALNWTFTLGTGLLDPWAAGASALVPADGLQPARFPELLERYDVTIFAGVPGIYRHMLKSGLPALPKLRHGLSAGEKLPNHICDGWAEATGTTIHEALGMSECSTYLSGSPHRPAPQGTLGFAQKGRKIAVLGPDHSPCPDGQTGMLAIHRNETGLMLGYLSAEGVELPLAGDWFLTGDLVARDASGAFTYQGRADSLLNAGGFRVSPLDIEAAFQPLTGDCIALSYEVKPGTHILALAHSCNIAEADLRIHAETVLADYKRPRLYAHLATLPRNTNGKLDRKSVIAHLQEAP